MKNLIGRLENLQSRIDTGYFINDEAWRQSVWVLLRDTINSLKSDNICKQVLEDECVTSWVSADLTTREGVKKAINDLCLFAVKIATDPATNGGLSLQPTKQSPSDLREALAEIAHSQWSGWMEYLFSKGKLNDDGTWTMPQWAVERWSRQMKTSYAELSHEEKESDRAEADKFLAVMTPRIQRERTEGSCGPIHDVHGLRTSSATPKCQLCYDTGVTQVDASSQGGPDSGEQCVCPAGEKK